MTEKSHLKTPNEVEVNVKDYFERDHNQRHLPNSEVLTAEYTLPFDIKAGDSGRKWTVAIERRLNFDFGANTVYSTFYIPRPDPAVEIANLCQQLVRFFVNDPLNFAPPALREDIRIRLNQFDRHRSLQRLIDARQIFLYLEAEVSEIDKERIYQYGDSQ
jgi:hypothetical protein